MFFEEKFQFELDWLNKLAALRRRGFDVIENVEYEIEEENLDLETING